MSENEAAKRNHPPQGRIGIYSDFFALLEKRSVPKIDRDFLQDQGIAKSHEGNLIAGLRFLGLIDENNNATDSLKKLSLRGEEGRKNLEKVVRGAYSAIFQVARINLETADPNTLVNCFKSDYGMGSIRTANEAAQIFVFLAEKAGIGLSEPLREELLVSQGARKTFNTTSKVRSKSKLEKGKVPQTSAESLAGKISEGAIARLIVPGTGTVDIMDKDTLDLAKGYLKILAKKLGIPEG